MPTQQEESQAKEFLQRAEIKTMRKDLSFLREADSVTERNKIAKIKTLEEQMQERQKELEKGAEAKSVAENQKIQNILQKNEQKEVEAEKDLKQYASEEDRQKIFLLESQKLSFEKQVEKIEKEDEPAQKLQKNQLLLSVKQWQEKLASIVAQEKKLEDEQKIVTEGSQKSTIPAERKGLEQRRWEIDKQIQEIEKTRWGAEKQIQDMETEVSKIDISLEKMGVGKNDLRNTIAGIDKSLRDIYSVVIEGEEGKRKDAIKERQEKEARAAGVRADEREQVRRSQWSGKNIGQKDFLKDKPASLKEKLAKDAVKEEGEREKFLRDIEQATNKNMGQQLRKSNTK